MNETFYGGFYGFESAPFHVTPDPSLLFPTDTHRAALGAIEYGIAAGKGFIAVTGEVGVGKTTVLRACLDGLDSSKFKIIYLFSPALSTAELYATILEEFDVTLPPTSNAADMLRVLQRTLLAVHQAGLQVVLAVDEAQQMPEATLESLRILSNLETEKSKLLQIILIGQPELEAVLAKHSMRQLAQRIAVRARVKSLTFRQSLRYIMHRTRCAGRLASRPLFTTPALLYLAFVAGGSPRTINICCDNALMNGYGHGAERITFGIVRDACKSMKFRSGLPRVAVFAATLIVLVGLFATGNTFLRHFYAARAEPVPAGTQVPPPSSDPAPTDGPGLDGPELAKRSGEPDAQPLPSAPQDPSPGDSEGRGASPPAGADSAGSAAAGAAAAGVAAGEVGSAAKGATAATGAVATPGLAPAAAGQDGAQKLSSTDAPPGPAASAPSETPAALRPAPANPVPAAPLPWIASDDASAGQTRATHASDDASAGQTRATHASDDASAGQRRAAHAADDASAGHTRATPNAVSKWVVREGDTVYKVCVVTYGSCEERRLRTLLADNPKLGRDATIRPGDILVLRKRDRSSN
jgi:general secretion pathway protein A